MAEKIVKSNSEWREQLSEAEFRVTRKAGTERPFSNDNFPKAPGVFHCKCCNAELFDSKSKFDSRTGWPSFFEPKNAGAVGERDDNSLFRRRTEVVCNRCDAHLGHVFPDGPKPTGLRYCINGIALSYQPT